MSDLKVSLVQTPLHWESPVANLAMLEEKMSILESTDVIVLPEMFSTGFTMNASEHSEPMNFTSMKWLKQQAARHKAVVTGSVIIRENQQFFNRLLWVEPEGRVHYYDKRHLFRMGEEHETYTAGHEKLIVSWKGWRIAPFICYDLRFPVWLRNTYDNHAFEYDVSIFIANWPAVRNEAWNTLLKARAIENSSYVIGVNRIGRDGNNIDYCGGSQVVNAKGEELKNFKDSETISTITLSRDKLDSYRTKFPVHMDGDNFIIKESPKEPGSGL